MAERGGRVPGERAACGVRLALLTLVSLTCFAANSLLCRAALGKGRIDPASFTLFRIAALGATRAAAVQLAVPVIAGAGATVFLDERLTPHIAAAGVAILGGVALTLRR